MVGRGELATDIDGAPWEAEVFKGCMDLK